jgi:hypothetical protein
MDRLSKKPMMRVCIRKAYRRPALRSQGIALIINAFTGPTPTDPGRDGYGPFRDGPRREK